MPKRRGWNTTLAQPTKGMARESRKRAAERMAETPIRAAYLRSHRRCEVKLLGGFAVPDCLSDELHIHEPWTRARGGSTDDPRNMATACDYHNDWISQDAAGQAFAEANGLLVHEWDGDGWLAAGGRMKGKSLAQALESIGIVDA